MKKLTFILLSVCLLLAGCKITEEQQRLDHIQTRLTSREVWWNDSQSGYYIVRAPDGSVWQVERQSSKPVENLTFRQIFSPNK